MSEFVFKRANLSNTKVRMAISSGAGCGKTLGALKVARGLAGPNGRISVIDTERKRSEAYAGESDIGGFDVLELNPPFSSQRFIDALTAAFSANYDVVIIDNLSAEWAGTGGILDQVSNLRGRGNEFTIWKAPSAAHSKLIDMIVRSPVHIICTLRSKVSYEIQDENGKKVPRKIGLAPICREGTDFEFDIVFDVDQDHKAAVAKCNASYARALTEALSVEQMINVSLGKSLRNWLATGTIQVAMDYKTRLANAASAVGEDKVKDAIKEVLGREGGTEVVADADEAEKVLVKLRALYLSASNSNG